MRFLPVFVAALASIVLWAEGGRAQVPVERLVDALEQLGDRPSPHAVYLAAADRVPVIVERAPGQAFGSDLSPVSDHFAVSRAPIAELSALADRDSDLRLSWAPPLRPLLSRALPAIGAPSFRNETGRTGQGVVVGIVDTGLDVTHPDLRNADGTSRVDWLIDFSRSARGVHPDIEARCSDSGLRCAIFSGEDLDALIEAGDRSALPDDSLGHGTHVASLAAGNGLGSASGELVGVAPEASLIIARVTDRTAAIADVDVLKAVELIYHLAGEHRRDQGLEPMPAVVNLSLGSDFGPHDGSSPLSRALADFVGADSPGRALIVAAGNSGALLAGVDDFPNPLGVHTEVHVARGMSTRVPLVSIPAPVSGSTLDAAIFVWIAMEPGSDLAVGLDRLRGRWIPPVARGEARSFEDEDIVVTIVNGVASDEVGPSVDVGGAVVLIEGRWPVEETFAVRLRGPGTASLWVQSEGDLGPSFGSLGALFPAAIKEGTVAVPAVHPELIAVGATLNRTAWTDRTGMEQTVDTFGSRIEPQPGTMAYFSAAGPNAQGAIKPDVVAPGAFVVGAMSREADPADNPLSVFALGNGCTPVSDCSVVDDFHAVTSGTSMAAPIVAGAVALMLEEDPELTQPGIRRLLQTGASPLDGRLEVQVGGGAVDLDGTLAAMTGGGARTPSARSTFVVAQSFVRPGGRTPTEALVRLRDEEGLPADDLDAEVFSVRIDRGRLVEEPERVAAGLWRFTFVADEGTGGAELELAARAGERTVARKRLPIATDTHLIDAGVAPRGGCAVAPGGREAPAWLWAWGALIAWRGRRCRRGARRARGPGRKGRSGSVRRGWFLR